MEWRRDLQPLSAVSGLRLNWRFVRKALAMFSRRLVGRFEPPVEGWSLGTTLVVWYLTQVNNNDRDANRKILAASARFVDSMLKEPTFPVAGDGFRGVWLRNPSPASHPITFTSTVRAAALQCTHACYPGGGFTTCTARSQLGAIADIRKVLAKEYDLDARIFSFDYTLAPEARYPTQIHEALAAYSFVATTFPTHPIVLVGDSAGGNLVLALMLSLKAQATMRPPAAAVVISPWCNTDVRTFSPSYAQAHHMDAYLPLDASDAIFHDPLVVPELGDFTGCCPVLLHYGGKESFADDCARLAAVLRQQKVPLTVEVEPLAPHVSPILASLLGEMGLRGVRAIAAFVASTAATTSPWQRLQ
ncbi:hypothetical protein ACHHYP_16489 [Achlya hypogyna]|uniref:Alpha/beta hydrolase fold-3 domain-containing protein n=1 Tax=Achlya hypogyna TaxID=1202772 RepID=A0A1V9Y6M4_ACHHY|nr:hypothetical protein ACHHYP_16489 [Achlya hypogyna]